MKPRNRLIGLAVCVAVVAAVAAIAQVRYSAGENSPARLDLVPQVAAKNPTAVTTSVAQPGAPPQNDSHTVRVLTSLDPEFNATLDRDYPELRNVPEFEGLRSKVVIVQNLSSREIHALVMKWTTEAPGETPSVTYTPYMLTPTTKRVLTGGVILAPNESRLLSPWFSLSRAQHAKMATGGGSRGAVAAFLNSNSGGAAKNSRLLSSSVDAAVFNDSAVVGPDETKMLDHFECERNGQHDEGVSVWRSLKANASDQEITTKLNDHIERGRVLRGNTDRESLYYVARAGEAHMLLQVFKQGGRAKLEQTVKTILRYKPTKLRRV